MPEIKKGGEPAGPPIRVPLNRSLDFPTLQYPGFSGAGVNVDPLLGGSHAYGMSSAFDPRDVAYANQSKTNLIGNTAADLLFNMTGKALTGLAFVPNMALQGIAEITGYYGPNDNTTYIDKVLSHGLTQIGTGLSDWSNKSAFTRQTRSDYEGLDLFDQAKRSEFWTHEVSDGAAFMLSNILTLGLSAEGKVGEAMMKLPSAVGLLKNSKLPFTQPNIVGMSNFLGKVGANVTSAASEALFEAKDTKENATHQMKLNRMKGEGFGVGMTDEEIDIDTAKKARNVFLLNVATLAVTNHIEMESIFGKMFNSGAKQESKYGLSLLNDVFKAKSYSGAAKLLFDAGYTPGVVAKKVLTNAFTESTEESLQESIQRINDASSVAKSFGRSFVDFAKMSATETFNYAQDKERAKAAFLGALIGVGSVGAGALAQGVAPSVFGDSGAAQFRSDRALAESQATALHTGDKGWASSILKRDPDTKVKLDREGDTFRMTPEGGKPEEISKEKFEQLATLYKISPETGGEFSLKGELDVATGSYQIDPDKLQSFMADTKEHAELQTLLETETDPTSIKYKLARRQKLAKLAAHFHDIGEHDLLLETIEKYRELDHQARHEAGFNTVTDEEFNREIDDSKEYVSQLKQLHDTLENSVVPTDRKRKERLREIGTQMLTLQEMIKAAPVTDERVELAATRNHLQNAHKKAMNNFLSEMSIPGYTEENLTKLAKEVTALKDSIDSLPLIELFPSPQNVQAIKSRTVAKDLEPIVADLQKRFLKLVDFKSGNKNLALDKDPIYSSNPNLTLSESITPELFEQYVETKTSHKKLASRIDNAVQEELDKYLDEAVQTQPLDTLFKNLESYQPSLTPEQADKIRERLDVDSETHARLKEMEGDYDYDQDAVDEKLSELEQGSLQSISNREKVESLLTQLTNKNTNRTDEELRAEVIEDLKKPAYTLVQEYIDAPESFTADRSAAQELVKMEHLNRLAPWEEYESLKAYLTEAKETASRNLVDRDLAIKEQVEFNNSGLTTLLNSPEVLAILKALPNWDKLSDLLVTHPEVVLNEARKSAPQILPLLDKMRKKTTESPSALLTVDVPDSLFALNPAAYFQRAINEARDYSTGAMSGEVNLTGFDANKESALAVYLKNFNLARFLKTSRTQERTGARVSSESLVKLIEAYQEVRSVDTATQILTSSVSQEDNDQSYAAVVAALAKTTNIVPSTEQRTLIMQVVRWFQEQYDVAGQFFANSAYYKGLAGSGKSMILRYIVRTLGLSDTSVLLTGSHETAAKNLLTVTSSAHKPLTHTELVNALNSSEEYLRKIKLLVFDEVGNLNPYEVEELQQAIEAYRAKNQDVQFRVLYLGDPNQMLSNEGSVAPLDNPYFETLVPSGTGIDNLRRLDSLTVTFRSDIDAMHRVQDSFRNGGDLPVESLPGATNQDVSTVKGLKGVVVSSAGMIQHIVKSVSENPTRSKMIVTDNPATTKALLDALRLPDVSSLASLNIEVYSPTLAQGLTRSEVYIDTKYPKSFLYQNLNNKMYTLSTRPVDFMWISNFPASEQIVDSMMESKAAANHDQKMAMLKANGQSEIDLDAIYKALRGESVKPAEKAKDATVKPDEPITDTKSTEGAIKSSPVKTKSSGSVSLSHIQHTGFDSGDKPVKGIKQLRKTYGDNIPAYLLKDQLDRVWLVSPNENNKVFRKLALVTSEELTQLGVDPNDLVRSTLRNYQNLESLTVSDEALPVSSLKRVYITEANDLSYSYDGAKTVLLDTPEFSVVTNLMNKWATSFLEGYPTLSNDPTIEFENWGEMLSDYSKFISIQKPHNKGSEALDKEFSSEKSVHLDENKPYMIIRGLKFKSSGKVLTPQFIKLDASDFDTARNEEMMNGMKKFLALANKFESLTSTMPDRFRWQNMRIGEYSHVNGVYLMGAFITKLADYHRWLTDSATDKSKSPIMVVDEFEGNGPSLTLFKYALDENKNKVARTDDGNFPPIPLNTLDRLNIDGKTIYELAHELDQMVHGEWDSTKKSYFRVKRNGDTHSLGKTRRYESRLQQLLAEFAASNFAAKLPTGEVVYLRDYVGKNVDAAKSSSGEPVAYKIEFPSLIGPISAEATVELNERDAQGKKQIRNIPKKHKATNPFSKKYFDWLTEVLRDGRTRAENYGIEVPLLEENEHLKRKLVPLKALNTIFGTKEGTFDHLNNGFGVREPLNDNLYSGKNLPALNGALKTNFNGVIPATMSISLTVEDSSLRPEASDLEIPAEDLSKPPLPFEFDEVTTSNVQDDEELDIALRKSVEKDLGRTISPKEAFKLFDRWLKTKSTPRTWKLSTVMSKLTTDSQIKKDCK